MVGASGVESMAAQRGGELPVIAEYVRRPGGPPEALLGSLLKGCFLVQQRGPHVCGFKASGCLSPQEDWIMV